MLQPTQEYDARFDIPPEEIPYGPIALAVFLTVFGIAAVILAWLHFTQQIFGKEQAVGQQIRSLMRQPLFMHY